MVVASLALALVLAAPSQVTVTPSGAATPASSASTTAPATTSGDGTLPAADAKPGLDTGPTVAAQIGAGVAACCVGGCITLPCGFIPFVGGPIGSCIGGLLIGSTEVVVGDAVGQKRGSLLIPALAAGGILAAGSVATVVTNLVFGVTGNLTTIDPANPAALAVPPAALAISLGISLTTVTAALVVPAVLYQFTAVDKEPGDAGGFGMPGVMEPADPTGTRSKAATTPATTAPPSATTPAPSTPAPSTTAPATPAPTAPY
jgi:hypothetical protein